MITILKKYFFKVFVRIDAFLKFPHLKKGDIAIQVGFDMSAPVTSDLFLLNLRVGNKGVVYGIDPDPNNHIIARSIIQSKKLNIKLIEKGTFNKKEKTKLIFGNQSSWNQLKNIPIDETVDFSGGEKEVEIDTLDNVIKDNQIDVNRIKHINITNNGAEYATLQGMNKLLQSNNSLGLTVVAGRYDRSGVINGKPDYEVISEFFTRKNIKFNFKRRNELIWWSLVQLIINRRWVFNKNNYGIIMAGKGKCQPKWYQSFS